MKASDRFCYGCKEFICSTKFGLVKSHREELCIECEAAFKRKQKENALARRKAEYEENKNKVPKSAYGSEHDKALKMACDRHEELKLKHEIENSCGL